MTRAWLLLVAVAGACATRQTAPAPTIDTPIEPIDRFDGELAAAHGKRRVVALVSPT